MLVTKTRNDASCWCTSQIHGRPKFSYDILHSLMRIHCCSFVLNKDSLCYGQCMDDSVTACTRKQTINFKGSLGLLSPLESEAFWFHHS